MRKIDQTIHDNLRAIEGLASGLPEGKRLRVLNKTRMVRLALAKSVAAPSPSVPEGEENVSAMAAILSALYQGRKLSQLDCREFGVEDMRTPVAHLRRRFQGTHRLCSRWIETPVHRSRIKEYWLEEKEVSAE